MKAVPYSLFVLFSYFLLAGCGEVDKVDLDPTSSKTLFSFWTHEGTTFTIDLRQGKLGIPNPFIIVFNTGHECNFNMNFLGTATRGDYSITDSTYQPGTGDGIAINCSTMNSMGTYEIKGATLFICAAGDPNNCERYY